MQAQQIFTAYEKDLGLVVDELVLFFKGRALPIELIGRHIIDSGGKRIRPLFLLLSADLSGYKGKDKFTLAALIESIHTASLLHDDVVDKAKIRRNKQSANMKFGDQIVILVGDFLYSNALRIVVLQKNQKIMEALSEATTLMTEGEILQIQKTGDTEITIDEYFKIISAKTGILISVACKIGSILGRESEQKQIALAEFGLKTGIAFQLMDDILDYVSQKELSGKELGKDLEEGKITMPLIQLLKSANIEEKDRIKHMITQIVENKNTDQGENLSNILDLFSKYNSIDKSLNIANSIIDEAKRHLNIFRDSKQKESLITLAEYIIKRRG